MDEFDKLVERVEALTGADTAVDEAIYRALGYWYDAAEAEWCAPDSPLAAEGQDVPAYTASLDAALTLVPEGEPVAFGFRQTSKTRPWVQIGMPWHGADTTAETLPLALTAAALRARAQQRRDGEG